MAKGYFSTICRRCGHQIYMQQTPRGKWLPLNADGTLHFIGCSWAGAVVA